MYNLAVITTCFQAKKNEIDVVLEEQTDISMKNKLINFPEIDALCSYLIKEKLHTNGEETDCSPNCFKKIEGGDQISIIPHRMHTKTHTTR